MIMSSIHYYRSTWPGDGFKTKEGSSHCGSVVTNWISIHEDAGLIPGLAPQWVKYLVLLWLWCRPAATAPIPPLAWKLPYAVDVVLKRQKKKKLSRIHIPGTKARLT